VLPGSKSTKNSRRARKGDRWQGPMPVVVAVWSHLMIPQAKGIEKYPSKIARHTGGCLTCIQKMSHLAYLLASLHESLTCSSPHVFVSCSIHIFHEGPALRPNLCKTLAPSPTDCSYPSYQARKFQQAANQGIVDPQLETQHPVLWERSAAAAPCHDVILWRC
jgi:hypothetical protein